MTTGPEAPTSGLTAWSRGVRTPLRTFLHTEAGGGVVLLAAAVAALVWVNVHPSSYDELWETTLSIDLGGSSVSLPLREWVNSGLMTFFFFVVGLEARREFDLGELRERRRFILPMAAALGGMGVAVGIYLAVNAGEPSASGWGVAMSTDTAFALGLLALAGSRFPSRLRTFMLTVVVIDDLVALVVIATVYSSDISTPSLLVAAALFAVVLLMRTLRVTRGVVYLVLGAAVWLALLESGIEPVVAGIALGLLAPATPATRSALEQASERFREFREQPTPELARAARERVRLATSPNERLQLFWHPWTSYVIVPLFALANAGIAIDAAFLERAATSPIALGIVAGYVAGKPVGLLGATWLATRLSGGRLRPPVGWLAVAGGGASAGLGFTVALLVATLAFSGPALEEAKVGILAAAILAALLTWLVVGVGALLPKRTRARALLGTASSLVDLAVAVDPERDHIRGPVDAAVTVVEYADFECPFCGQAEDAIRELLGGFVDVRYVWRHLPLVDVHPNALFAAEAAEAAHEQGAFWEMHDLLFADPDALVAEAVVARAERLGLDTERFERDLRERAGAGRVAEDVDGADLSGVSGTPTFFINGRRHYGAYDAVTLSAAVRAAGARARLARPR